MSAELPKPIKTVWLIGYSGPEKTDIYKESDKCIWLKDDPWRGTWTGKLRRKEKPRMFETREHALRHLVMMSEGRVANAEERVSREKMALQKLKEQLEKEITNPTA